MFFEKDSAMKRFFSVKLLFLVPLAFTSCAWYETATIIRDNNLKTYDGDRLPKNEVGFLCKSPEVRALEIFELDGRKIQEIKEATGFTGRSDVLELLPGEHVIRIIGGTDSGASLPVSDMTRWSYSIGGEWKMKFSVEPGHVYLLDLKVGAREKRPKEKKAESSYTVSSLFIRDGRTKKIVSEILE
jgi:hypothetical protein